MIIDGRAIAKEILDEVRATVGNRLVVVRAIVIAPTAVTESYLRIKTARAVDAGMELHVIRLGDAASEEEVVLAINEPGADAVIVQLPLPKHLEEAKILSHIPVEKDVDVLSATARARFARAEQGALMPPVAAAVAEILTRAQVTLQSSSAVVIGNGWLVGQPVAIYLKNAGIEVTVLDKNTFEEHKETLLNASIIVSGAGVPNLITPELIKEGAILIDAGTSEQGGVVVGDIDPACVHKASVYTPVPGGVGPITVACLLRNVLALL